MYICLYARPLPSLSGNRTHARTRTSPRGVCLLRLHKLITRAAHSEFSRAKNQRIIGSMRSPSQSCNLVYHTPQVVYILAQRSKGAHGDRLPPYTWILEHILLDTSHIYFTFHRHKLNPACPMLFMSRSQALETYRLLLHFEKHVSWSSICNSFGLCHLYTHCLNIHKYYMSPRYLQTIKMHTYSLQSAPGCIEIITVWGSIFFRPLRFYLQLLRSSAQTTCYVFGKK